MQKHPFFRATQTRLWRGATCVLLAGLLGILTARHYKFTGGAVGPSMEPTICADVDRFLVRRVHGHPQVRVGDIVVYHRAHDESWVKRVDAIDEENMTLFLKGDNPKGSYDSRYADVGWVDMHRIEGIVVKVLHWHRLPRIYGEKVRQFDERDHWTE